MHKDFLNLKIYDKKVYWKDALAEVYNILAQENENMYKLAELTNSEFKSLDIAVDSLEEKAAINKIISHWTSFLLYVSRVNFLINIVTLSNESRGVKKKEINEFRNTATSDIESRLDAALFWIQFHISYFYFKFIEIREEPNTNKTIVEIYLNSFQSAVDFIDDKSGNGATKFRDKYSLKETIKIECLNKIIEIEEAFKNVEDDKS
jgi:hypothetical protein